ncbi:histone-lysine N-methyltransferase SETMAR [Nothoprocta perdicaria]|nr:histone-lysine N-methyltransferase SETMAR [Nothoprocta perdicaria]
MAAELEPLASWAPGAAAPPFQYSPENVAGADGALDPTEIAFPGCSCLSCAHPACSCLRHGDNYRGLCLGPTEDERGFARPVFECSALCRCGHSCPNRLVQRGLQFRLQVFQTARKGWGLRTLEFIAKGRFVCEYAGEVLGVNEARRRIQAQAPEDSNYIIAVREHLHSGQILETFIDPTYIGNVGRFLNHSCEPNLFMVPVRVDSMVPRLALFAATDISPGEELSYDYSGRFHNMPVTNRVPETSEEGNMPKKPCYCGARTCTSFLPCDSSLFSTPDTCPESSS